MREMCWYVVFGFWGEMREILDDEFDGDDVLFDFVWELFGMCVKFFVIFNDIMWSGDCVRRLDFIMDFEIKFSLFLILICFE